MKQVGLGRGYIRVLATNGAAQSAVGKPRTATSSSAFNVDELVGRPNIISGGHIQVLSHLKNATKNAN